MPAAATCIAWFRSISILLIAGLGLGAQGDPHHADVLAVEIAGQLVVERGLARLAAICSSRITALPSGVVS